MPSAEAFDSAAGWNRRGAGLLVDEPQHDDVALVCARLLPVRRP